VYEIFQGLGYVSVDLRAAKESWTVKDAARSSRGDSDVGLEYDGFRFFFWCTGTRRGLNPTLEDAQADPPERKKKKKKKKKQNVGRWVDPGECSVKETDIVFKKGRVSSRWGRIEGRGVQFVVFLRNKDVGQRERLEAAQVE